MQFACRWMSPRSRRRPHVGLRQPIVRSTITTMTRTASVLTKARSAQVLGGETTNQEFRKGHSSFWNGGTASIATAAASAVVLAASAGWCPSEGSTSTTSSSSSSSSSSSILTTTTTQLEEQPPPPQADSVDQTDETDDDDAATTLLLNWSGTHSTQVSNDRHWEPETVSQVQEIVAHCHKQGYKIRPMGSALSPNGIAFCNNNHEPGGIIGLANLDRLVHVDTQQQTVTVQAGARVAQVVEALRPYHLTLPNLASIAEQQMGGFVQVGAHGTGQSLSPVDHYVTELVLVTPGQGTLTLTPADGSLFELAKVGLGCLGVVVQVTMKCVPAHELVEHTYCLSRQQAMDQIDVLLKQHKHIRYMWIPYTDTVVVVTNDPKPAPTAPTAAQEPSIHDTTTNQPKTNKKKKKKDKTLKPPKDAAAEEARFQPLRDLLLELREQDPNSSNNSNEDIAGMGFGDLRDAIVAYNPLDVDHVKRCNQAEAEFWKRSEGYQTKPSDQLLQFDCGGQQWVLEMCFPTGTQQTNNGNDMKFMAELLEGIEQHGIPAHSPIEQRWTASSSSLMVSVVLER